MTKVDWDLVLKAGFLTMAVNFLFTYAYGPYHVPLDYAKLLIPISMIVAFLKLLRDTYNHSKLGRVRKLRLVYLGVSLFSFLFAVQDVVVFLTGVRGFQLSNDLPYFWLGSVPVPSILGSLLLGSLFNSTLGSSIVNASLDVNPSFPWFFADADMKDELTLGVSIRVHESLIAISDRFGASQTAIFTFFGQSIGIMSQEMYAFKQPLSQLMVGYPFIVSLRLPSSCYYADSQPSPIEYYVKQDERWAMFSLDFLEGRYAQTLLCNFVDPVGQSSREIWIFLIGVFSALSISFGIEAASRFTKKAGIEEGQKVESQTSSPTNQQQRPVDIKKLIDLVDTKFEKRPRLQYLLSFGLVIVYSLAVGIIGYLLSLLSLGLAHVQGEGFSSYIGLVAALISFVGLGINIPRILPPEERLDLLVNHNFRKIGKEKDVNEWERPVLKGLIKMKSKNPEFNLKDIPNKELFDENGLLKRLYRTDSNS